jgi:hypothetical protein
MAALGTLTVGKALADCGPGQLNPDEVYCWCGRGWRLALYCYSAPNSYESCGNGIHLVNCAHSLCDIYDGLNCSSAFDSWFDQKLHSRDMVETAAGVSFSKALSSPGRQA